MSTRLHQRTIPSAFVRLDDTMSDPDAFFNVRDAQTARLNHNILVARGVRQPCFSLNFRSADDVRDPLLYKALGVVPTSGGVPHPEVFLQLPIFVPPWCQALELVGSLAYASGSGADLPLYAKVDAEGETTNWPSAATITVTSATAARFSGEVVVPPNAARQGLCLFTLAMDGMIYGADLKGVGTVFIRDVGLDSGRPYIDADFNNTNVGNAIYIEGRLDINPRLCVDDYHIGGGAVNGTAATYRCYLDYPFNENPQPGVDFANARQVQGLKPYTLSCWPKAISDFETGVDLP